VTSSYGLNTPTVSAGSTAGVQTVEQLVDDLPSGKTLHYRIVATTGPNSTYGEDRTVRIASAPDISSTGSRERTASSAVLTAAINPVGYDTNYHFEYGATSNLGQSAPASPVDIGDGTDPVPVSQPISGLSPGVTYHFRVIAENQWGIAMSEDTTFEFLPSSCPNDLVRQQTRASFLPDCRAYELVSPPAAGAVNLWPGNEVFDLCNSDECNWPVNRGFSVGQQRFGYFGGLGAISGLDPATGLTDLYMASRTAEGWVTIVPTLKSNQAFLTKGKQCSIAMDVCIDHVRGEAGFVGEEAPYAFDAQGNGLGQLPTNVDSVTNGSQFRGDQRLSDDGTHFVFSSGEAPNVFGELIEPPVFAPGGKNSGLGSAYDNDIAAGTVTLISRLPKGSNPGEPEEEPHLPEEKPVHEAIRLPGVSKDASHILMQIPAAGSGTHLFMRVNDAITYDISKGGEVTKTIGMTSDGSVVYFTSDDQLLPADTDSGVDLYRWNESSPSPDSLQLISQGNGQGNATDCVAPFEGCSIRPLSPQREHPFQNQLVAVPGQDDVMAEGSGDVYFFSPESLDPGHPGIKNEPNLYLYRDGNVQLVATFDPGTDINRMQISTDGSHAAMVTKSQLTSQNINGTEQMYSYDANTGVIRCASCDPRGRTPLRSVKASQNGRFMADDGRTFFSTEEALVPEDGDGTIIDTYEYVGGRPQLISSGQGSRDFTGGSELVSLAAKPEFIGLEHVSRDGVDVFFSTYETLVPQDNNGRFVKFYDARTNGGFLDRVDLGPCAAADECHGSDTAPPASPVVTTATNMGDGGNVHRARKHRKKHRKKRRRAAGHRRAQHHGHPAGKSAASNQRGGRRG
jgi:hypothetical protein